MIAVFILATLLPYVAGGWLTRASHPAGLSTDRSFFETMVLGTGALYCILNVVAFGGVMSIPTVAAGGILAVVTVCLMIYRTARSTDSSNRLDPAPSEQVSSEAWTNRASLLVVAVICGVWLLHAASGLEIFGADADHYHIPQAANFALGASPWGLRATPHTYPMGTSVLFAWFIVPFGDSFLIEAGMLVWYLVLLASIAALFRELTGLSGWTWAVWIALVLTSLPLIHDANGPSSDLSYSASFIAVTTQLTWMVKHRAGKIRDWGILGLALGLLVGCKTSGAYSAVMLLGAAVVIHVATRRAIRWRSPRSWAPPLLVVASAGLFAGGIWLVRNAWLFGQPVEIITDRYYGSMLSELKTTYGGDWLYLFWRLKLMIARWLDPNFLLGTLAVAWLAIESVVLVIRRRADHINVVRLWFLCLMSVVIAVHLVGLVGAPWTGLEWTGGRSLRYALPLWIVFGLLAYVALFSRWLRWYEHAVPHWIGWSGLGAVAIWSAAGRSGLGSLTAPDGLWAIVVATIGVLVVYWSVTGRTSPFLSGRARLIQPLVSLAVLAGAAIVVAPWLTSRHATLRAEAKLQEYNEFEAWRRGVMPALDPDYRQVFLEVRADELRRGEGCRDRRFFITSRFDAPLALQPARYSSLLFESRGYEAQALKLLSHGLGPKTCDYIVVNRKDLNRQVLTAAGEPIASAGMFLTFRVIHP